MYDRVESAGYFRQYFFCLEFAGTGNMAYIYSDKNTFIFEWKLIYSAVFACTSSVYAEFWLPLSVKRGTDESGHLYPGGIHLYEETIWRR